MLQSVTESDLLPPLLFRSLPGFVELPFCENGNLKSQGLRCFRRLAWLRGSVRYQVAYLQIIKLNLTEEMLGRPDIFDRANQYCLTAASVVANQ
jgi:hypothetical protein